MVEDYLTDLRDQLIKPLTLDLADVEKIREQLTSRSKVESDFQKYMAKLTKLRWVATKPESPKHKDPNPQYTWPNSQS